MHRAIATIALLCAFLAGGCLPNPQSVEQRRKSFDRSAVKEFILSSAPDNIQFKHDAIFDNRIKFLGFDIDKQKVKPGDYLKITSYFEALKPIDENYQIFMHLDGSVRISGDHFPAAGRYPTDVWQKGEIIKDVHTVRIEPHFNSRFINLYLGFYIGKERMPISNERETRHDGKRRARAGAIPVELGEYPRQ